MLEDFKMPISKIVILF